LGLEAKLEASASAISDSEILALIAQRQAARDAKNWGEADRIRTELKAQGIELVDKDGQTTWLR
jgi:cysteinyl-tRNA synthetase